MNTDPNQPTLLDRFAMSALPSCQTGCMENDARLAYQQALHMAEARAKITDTYTLLPRLHEILDNISWKLELPSDSDISDAQNLAHDGKKLIEEALANLSPSSPG